MASPQSTSTAHASRNQDLLGTKSSRKTIRSSKLGAEIVPGPLIRTHYSYKTEKWREQGEQRWPQLAERQMQKQPAQFLKDEEMVPLQRLLENPEDNIQAELWRRSLRTKILQLDKIGRHNTSIATATTSSLFDEKGSGWSGKTNATGSLRRPGQKGPHVKEWIERPVAVGRFGLQHMDGSRYAINMTPRSCVLDSLSHMRTKKNDGRPSSVR